MADVSSKKIVILAIVGNAVITVAKAVAAAVSGSGAMWAETIHSLIDTTNQGLLLIGYQRSIRKPTRKFPYGFAIEANFWGLLAAIGILIFGGGITIYHGVYAVRDPHLPSNTGLILAVLAFAVVVEGYVLLSVVRGVRKTREGKRWLAHLQSQPAGTITVLLEDAAAVAGCFIAAAAVILGYYTNSGMPDAIAQLLIGAMLAMVGLYLMYRNWGVLIGQALSEEETTRIDVFIGDLHGIKQVVNIKTRRLAPHMFTLTAEVVFSGGEVAGSLIREFGPIARESQSDAGASEVLGRFADQLFIKQAVLVDRLEEQISKEFPEAVHIDLEPHLHFESDPGFRGTGNRVE